MCFQPDVGKLEVNAMGDTDQAQEVSDDLKHEVVLGRPGL